MRKFIFKLRFFRYIQSISFNPNKHNLIEMLAFQTVVAIKLNPIPKFTLSHNKLTTFDSIIFTMFVVRMIGICNIEERAKAEMFSQMYIDKVMEYFPDWKKISQEYDLKFFENRIEYYNSIVENAAMSDGEPPIEEILNAFETIITYDYAGQYVHIEETTPILIGDIFEKFKIHSDIMSYYNKYFDEVYIPLLKKIYDKMNNL